MLLKINIVQGIEHANLALKINSHRNYILQGIERSILDICHFFYTGRIFDGDGDGDGYDDNDGDGDGHGGIDDDGVNENYDDGDDDDDDSDGNGDDDDDNDGDDDGSWKTAKWSWC